MKPIPQLTIDVTPIDNARWDVQVSVGDKHHRGQVHMHYRLLPPTGDQLPASKPEFFNTKYNEAFTSFNAALVNLIEQFRREAVGEREPSPDPDGTDNIQCFGCKPVTGVSEAPAAAPTAAPSIAPPAEDQVPSPSLVMETDHRDRHVFPFFRDLDSETVLEFGLYLSDQFFNHFDEHYEGVDMIVAEVRKFQEAYKDHDWMEACDYWERVEEWCDRILEKLREDRPIKLEGENDPRNLPRNEFKAWQAGYMAGHEAGFHQGYEECESDIEDEAEEITSKALPTDDPVEYMRALHSIHNGYNPHMVAQGLGKRPATPLEAITGLIDEAEDLGRTEGQIAANHMLAMLIRLRDLLAKRWEAQTSQPAVSFLDTPMGRDINEAVAIGIAEKFKPQFIQDLANIQRPNTCDTCAKRDACPRPIQDAHNAVA